MNPSQIRHWVFDMDGTLTLAVHDFPAIKRALGIPQEHDILSHLAALPEDEAVAKHAWLLEHERELAVASTAAPGAVELVLEANRDLADRGPLLPAGLRLVLPDLPRPATEVQPLRLWG